MKRSDITVGQTLQVTCAKYRDKGLDLVTVLQCGQIFALVRVADGQPAPRGTGHTAEGYYWFHPNELQTPPAPKEETLAQAVAAQEAALRARGDTRLADNIAAARVTRTAAKVAAAIVANTKPKWETPGRHTITSYRSFRRYKAAGASFGVIPFNSSNRQPEKELVNISVSMARRRAQAGLSLVAVVSA